MLSINISTHANYYILPESDAAISQPSPWLCLWTNYPLCTCTCHRATCPGSHCHYAKH